MLRLSTDTDKKKNFHVASSIFTPSKTHMSLWSTEHVSENRGYKMYRSRFSHKLEYEHICNHLEYKQGIVPTQFFYIFFRAPYELY